MTAKTKRKAVLKVKIEAIFVVDLKDTKTVTGGTAAFEALKEKAVDLGFRITADNSAFGNADVDDNEASTSAGAKDE